MVNVEMLESIHASVALTESLLTEIIGLAKALPERQTVFVISLFKMLSVSLKTPTVVGENVTSSLAESPGTIVKDVVSTEKTLESIVIFVTRNVSHPVFLMKRESVCIVYSIMESRFIHSFVRTIALEPITFMITGTVSKEFNGSLELMTIPEV